MNTKNKLLLLFFDLLLTFLVPNWANAALVFTFEAAGVQNTTVPPNEYNVETFDTHPTGVFSGTYQSIIGSFSGSSSYRINSANMYGGAGGNTNYAFCSDSTPLTLSFPKPVGYFGFWWSAGDSANILEMTMANGNTRTYTTATLRNSNLLTPQHFGNPNRPFLGWNSGEAYIFLNFFATDDASKITSVKLRGSNFEADNFTTAVNRQPITGQPAEPGTCSAPQSAGTYPYCNCPSPKALNADGSACVIPVPPTVNDKTTTHLVPVNLNGNIGTSTTISSVTLTKTKDGLGANVTGTTTVSGTPITVATGATTWTISSGAVPVGVYTITITDGYSKTATGVLTVTCATGKAATATSCIDPIAPTVDVQSTTEGTPVPLTGKPGSSLIMTSVTLTKFEDGLNAPVVGSPVTVGSNITSGQTAWTTPTPSALQETVGKYTITATDANGKTGTNVLTVTCPTGKITTAFSCIQSTNPTVVPKTVKEKDPITLTGTVGDVALDSAETFTVQVNGKTYDKANAASGLTISSLNWTLNIPASDLTTILAANSPYDVVATRSGTLKDSTTGELIIETLSPPTVESQQTFDTTPTIKGTVGQTQLAATEAFTVEVNGKTYVKGTDVNLTVSGLNWTLQILEANAIPSKATAYDVMATRSGTIVDTTSGELTIKSCALPKVVSVDGQSCIDPVPTVVSQVIETNLKASPVIHGTVGDVPLGSSETFSVKILSTPIQTYNKGDNALVISGVDWTLTVPAANALMPNTYNVDAIRNTTAIDKTEKELVINLVCLTGQVAVNGVCTSTSILPTVDFLNTDDRTPTLTGTVGTTGLNAGEAFTVTIEGTGRLYTLGSSPELSVTGKNWSLAVPRPPLTPTTYDITATRNGNIVDATSGELTIQAQCIPPNIEEDGDCIAPVKIPTVNKLVTDISANVIAMTGTVGNIVLSDNETFTVKIHNSQHADIACSLSRPTTTTWTCTLLKPFVAGIFDVDAVRAGVADETDKELTITDNIAICENNVTKSIPKASWEPSKWGASYYLGNCETGGSEEFPVKPCSIPPAEGEECTDLPLEPLAKSYEVMPPTGSFCDDGGVKSSDAELSDLTIKRARIANTTTTKAIPDFTQLIDMNSSESKHPLKYGEMAIGTGGEMDIRTATITGGNQAYPVTLTGVTINNAFVDTQNDYIQNGVDTSAGTYLKIEGGSTKGTLMQGVITAGNDATGHPIRGSVTVGKYDGALPDNALTRGRRIQGTLTNATIINARTTTKHGETRIDAGEIQSGTMTDAKIFGTVVNAILNNATIKETNYCFSNGTIGNKGQLNWKEVVK